MEYKDFYFDFVTRTIEILSSEKTEYDVTLLINCLFGLIVIPTEYKYYPGTYKKYKEKCLEKIIQYSLNPLEKDCEDEQDLVKCIKNSLSHLTFQVGSDGGKITTIKFRNKKYYKKINGVSCKNKNGKVTEIEFTVDKLRGFALDMANYYLDIIQKRKRTK